MKDIIQSFPVCIKELITPTLSIWVKPEWRLGHTSVMELIRFPVALIFDPLLSLSVIVSSGAEVGFHYRGQRRIHEG